MNHLILLSAFVLLLMSPVAHGKKSPAGKTVRDSLAVSGPINLEVDINNGPVEIVQGKSKLVEIVQRDGSGRSVKLVLRDGDVRVLVDGNKNIDSADLLIRIPSKSSVEVSSIDGKVSVSGVGGEVEVEAISGRVTVAKATEVEVESVSGDVVIRESIGSASVETVSGDVSIEGKNHGEVEVESVSGDVAISGVCGTKCELDIEVLSGDVILKLASQSIFELEFESFSGTLDDKLGLSTLSKVGTPGLGMRYRGKYNAKGSAGEIDCETHSGSLRISKKK